MFKARINAKPSLIGKAEPKDEKEEVKPKKVKKVKRQGKKKEDEEIDFNDAKSDDEGV